MCRPQWLNLDSRRSQDLVKMRRNKHVGNPSRGESVPVPTQLWQSVGTETGCTCIPRITKHAHHPPGGHVGAAHSPRKSMSARSACQKRSRASCAAWPLLEPDEKRSEATSDLAQACKIDILSYNVFVSFSGLPGFEMGCSGTGSTGQQETADYPPAQTAPLQFCGSTCSRRGASL